MVGIVARELMYSGTLKVVQFAICLGLLVLFCLVLRIGSFTAREALTLCLWPANGGLIVLMSLLWFRLLGLFIGLGTALGLFLFFGIPFLLVCLIDQSSYCLGNRNPRCLGRYLVKVEGELKRRRHAGGHDLQSDCPPVADV